MQARNRLTYLCNSLLQRSLGENIRKLRALAIENRWTEQIRMLDKLSEDYNLMCRYYIDGYKDPMRESLYDGLTERLWFIANKMLAEATAQECASFKSAQKKADDVYPIEYGSISSKLQELEQQISLASLDADSKNALRIAYSHQYSYYDKLFSTIYTSGSLTEHEADSLTEAVVSPLASRTDGQIIVSALMLAQQEIFDIQKFRCLCDIVRMSSNIHVHTRALLAVLLTLPQDDNILRFYDDTIRTSLSLLFATPGIEDEVIELQLLVLQATQTSQASREINEIIMPFLTRTSMNNLMKDDSQTDIDDILHPEKEEEEQDKAEEYMERMHSMHDEGIDIFYGGMKGAKKYSFFYSLLNWFMPFYMEHPQLDFNIPLEGDYIGNITRDGAFFCDNDLYSFLITLKQSFSMLPQQLKELMEHGEMRPELGVRNVDDTCLRRRTLQDLYRFYNLSPHKEDFHNPFRTTTDYLFIQHNILSQFIDFRPYALAIARQMYRCKLHREVFIMERFLNFEKPSHIRLIMHNYAAVGYYEEAIKCADDLLEKKPNDTKTEESLVEYIIKWQKEYEEKDAEILSRALNISYRYLFEDETNATWALRVAECQLLQSEYEKALRTLQTIDDSALTDRMHILLMFFDVMNGNSSRALERIKRVSTKNNSLWNMIEEEVAFMPRILDRYADVEILIDLAASDVLPYTSENVQ